MTLGGLLPDFGFEEFATLFPCSQQWSLALYDAYKPQSRLLSDQTLTVADEAFCGGTLGYVANFQKTTVRIMGEEPSVGDNAVCRMDTSSMAWRRFRFP